MGCIGCCNECCLQEGDLPTLSITGMTGEGWEPDISEECCFTQRFTFDDDQPVSYWSEEYAIQYLEQTSVMDVVNIQPPCIPPTSYVDPTGVFDMPDFPEDCCCNEPYVAGQITDYGKSDVRSRFVVATKPADITIRIRKKVLSCRADNLCRWVVEVVYRLGRTTATQSRSYSRRLRTLVPTDSCSGYNGNRELDTESGSLDYNPTTLPVEPGIGISDPSISFVYIIDYETLPSTISLDNTVSYFDENWECLSDLCNFQQPVEEVCISYSTGGVAADTNPAGISIVSQTFLSNPRRPECDGSENRFILLFTDCGSTVGNTLVPEPNVTCDAWTGFRWTATTNAGNRIVDIAPDQNNLIAGPFSYLTDVTGCSTQPTACDVAGGWFGGVADACCGGGWLSQISFVQDADYLGLDTVDVCVPAPSLSISVS